MYFSDTMGVHFHVLLSPYFEFSSTTDKFCVVFEDRFTGWDNFKWEMKFERLVLLFSMANSKRFTSRFYWCSMLDDAALWSNNV